MLTKKTKTPIMLKTITKFSILSSFVLLLAFPVQSQTTCSSDAAQQLDFMLGDWDFFSKNGDVIGENSIKLIPGTCTIEEKFKSVDGLKSHSLMNYNEQTKRWSQVWSDDFGNRLYFTGTFQGNKLVMKATSTNAKGKKVHHKMTYYKKSNGIVGQTWVKSENQKEWSTVFSGTHKKKKAVL